MHDHRLRWIKVMRPRAKRPCILFFNTLVDKLYYYYYYYCRIELGYGGLLSLSLSKTSKL